MKKIICFIMCLILLASGGCSSSVDRDNKTCELYFLNSEETGMVTETRSIPEKTSSIVAFAVNELLKGPAEMENKMAIPEGTGILSVSVEDDIATINFTKKFDEGTNIKRLWSRYTLVCTVCSIEGIKKVRILTEGKGLIDLSTGEPLEALGKEDIITNSSQVHNNKTTLTLYFGDQNAMYLVAEARQVEIKEGEKTEKLVVKELLKGPVNEKLIALFDPEVKVLSTETKDGVCFVNFSEELATKPSGGSAEELLMVYSVVNSLCELENVEKVQFLIEGKKVESLAHMDMSEPFAANTELLISNNRIKY